MSFLSLFHERRKREDGTDEEEDGGERIEKGRGKEKKRQTFTLCYGKDGTGDLCQLDNIMHLAEQVLGENQS